MSGGMVLASYSHDCDWATSQQAAIALTMLGGRPYPYGTNHGYDGAFRVDWPGLTYAVSTVGACL